MCRSFKQCAAQKSHGFEQQVARSRHGWEVLNGDHQENFMGDGMEPINDIDLNGLTWFIDFFASFTGDFTIKKDSVDDMGI